MTLRDFRRVWPLMNAQARRRPIGTLRPGQFRQVASLFLKAMDDGILTVREVA